MILISDNVYFSTSDSRLEQKERLVKFYISYE